MNTYQCTGYSSNLICSAADLRFLRLPALLWTNHNPYCCNQHCATQSSDNKLTAVANWIAWPSTLRDIFIFHAFLSHSFLFSLSLSLCFPHSFSQRDWSLVTNVWYLIRLFFPGSEAEESWWPQRFSPGLVRPELEIPERTEMCLICLISPISASMNLNACIWHSNLIKRYVLLAQ